MTKEEQIEKDRETLRGTGTMTQGFSYIPFLVAEKSPSVKIKLKNLSTVNILIYLEEGFEKGDKTMLRNLDRIKKEISQRTGVFEAVLTYLENKKVRDDLYYWTPGNKISNIFSFIVELLPDFVDRYKQYFIENAVCGRAGIDAVGFIKEKFPNDFSQFVQMKDDLMYFNHCITENVWCDSVKNSITDDAVRVLEYLGIRKTVVFSEFLEASVVPKASFVDIAVGDRIITVSLYCLICLMIKDENYREFWNEKGVDYDNCEFRMSK